MISIILLLAFAALVAFYFYVRARLRAWRITRTESARLRAKGAAKARRPAAQRVLSALPSAVAQSLFRWRPPVRRRAFSASVAVARKAILGRRVRISLAQHILIAGQTGSGKSSTQRVLAAHILRAPNAVLEVWDLKRISALRDYRGRARVCTTAAEVDHRLADLTGREFLERTDRLIAGDAVPYLVVMIDETATLLRSLSQAAVHDLFTAIELGRELRVFFVLAVQHPLALTVPTPIRSQLSCVIAHRLKSAKESEVVFPGAVTAGWAPHLLGGPGTCLIWTHDASPCPAYGLWLSPRRFAAVRAHGRTDALTPPVSLTKAASLPSNQLSPPTPSQPKSPSLPLPPSAVRPSVRHETPGQAPGRTRRRTDGRLSARQAQALAALDMHAGPMGAGALARELGIARNRAHDVLRQLAAKNLVQRDDGTGTYTLTTTKDAER